MAFSAKPFIAGNWKMNGLRASLGELDAVREACAAGSVGRAEMALCVPATLISAASERAAGSPLLIGGQDCHTDAAGAHTGDVSAEMLRDAGATVVIVGHSERRANHGETDAVVLAKAEAARRAGLTAIICVGETRAERDGGETLRVIGRQIDESVPRDATPDDTIIAYEPVWAIGYRPDAKPAGCGRRSRLHPPPAWAGQRSDPHPLRRVGEGEQRGGTLVHRGRGRRTGRRGEPHCQGFPRHRERLPLIPSRQAPAPLRRLGVPGQSRLSAAGRAIPFRISRHTARRWMSHRGAGSRPSGQVADPSGERRRS